MTAKLIQLGDADLFGNEAAEDEDEDIFNSYAYERPELAGFTDPYRRLCFVRAYKGEGKSALLRLTQQRVRRTDEFALVVEGRNPNFSPSRADSDFDSWVRDWKATILTNIAQAIGSKLNTAFDDDGMAFVEFAEKAGVRERGYVIAFLARFKGKLSATTGPVSAEVQGQATTVDPEALMKRWATGKPPIWIFIDDVDQNFANDARHRAKVASFFQACRQLSTAIPEMRIRAAVRPNVWTILKYEFESLSHVEQYVTDLAWSEVAIRGVLARRVEGYLVRRNRLHDMADSLPTESALRERALIALVFEDPVKWGHRERPPHVLLHTLSKHRPRWVVELSSAAATGALAAQRPRVLAEDVFDQLETFGKKRVADTVAEFKSQCPQVEELIASLKAGDEEYSTDQLVAHLKAHVMEHLTPRISGVPGDASALDVAAFLFEIGVIFGRRDLPGDEYEHVGFTDDPSLLRARSNVDNGLRWEVHPVFRQVLGLRDSAGRHSPSKRSSRKVVRRQKTP